MSKPKHLLVVDDQKDFTDFVVDVAIRLGYTAQSANSARRFQELYAALSPDVIVLDIVMPDSDGIELIRWLSKQECRARIIIATGHGDTYARGAKMLGEDQGFLDIGIVHKPVKLDALRMCLSEAMGAPFASPASTSLTD